MTDLMDFIRKLLPERLQPYAGRLFWICTALVVSILILTLGWRALVIIGLIVVGYLAGKWIDKGRMQRDSFGNHHA